MLHLPQIINNIKAINLFQKTPCSLCGTILVFRTKPICSKCIHKLVTVRVNYTLGGRYISYGSNIHVTVSAFPCGRTQHVRCMCSSIVRVIHFVFIPKTTQCFMCRVMWPRMAVIFFRYRHLVPSKCKTLL